MGEDVEIEYGFSIVKTSDGKVSITPVEGAAEADLDTLYNACMAVCNDIQANKTAKITVMQLMAASEAMAKKASDIIVPKIGGKY